jgi:hypothetical protein
MMIIIDMMGDEETLVVNDVKEPDKEQRRLEEEYVKQRIAERAPIVVPVESK